MSYNPNLFAKLENGYGYNKTRRDNVLNPYVDFHKHTNTQSLADTLVAESIQMRGVECFYIRREFVKLDWLLGEDPQSKFEKAFKIAAYISSFEGYEGQRDFFSKFGMQVNDELTFQVNPMLFKEQTDGELAREGDLIYFPMGNALFELVWVESNQPFYQVGQSPIITITAQKFIYSGEKLDPKVKVRQDNPDVMPCAGDVAFDLDLEELTTFKDDPELTPVRNLDGLGDIRKGGYQEDIQIDLEGKEFIDSSIYDTVNGTGYPIVNPPQPTPFDDFI
ncbi:MAG: neck protein [Bacilli bacterium]